MGGSTRSSGFVILEWAHVLLGLLFVYGGYGAYRQTYEGAIVLTVAWVVGAGVASYYGLSGFAILIAIVVLGYVVSQRSKLRRAGTEDSVV